MKAPSLPTPAEIPCPVARISTGYTSLGITKGGHVRAELSEEVAHPIHEQERNHHGRHVGHQRDHGEAQPHHREAEQLQAAVPDPVHASDAEKVAGDRRYYEDRQL